MKKKLLKIVYMLINGMITILALYIFKKYLPLSDRNIAIKILLYSIVVLLLFVAIHCLFMRIIFREDNDKSKL